MKKIFISALMFIGLNLFAADNPHVVLETNQGSLELELFPDIAPKAVENFTTHVKNGYYNGVIFHRIIKNFMIQGGDPTGSGRGGESIWGKEFKNEYAPNVIFDKAGILAMANRGPNTNGSQFFITTGPAHWLNGGYTIFGQLSKKSFETLQKLNNVPTGYADKPIKNQTILKAYIKK
jgi:peptidylprolyl isomerase